MVEVPEELRKFNINIVYTGEEAKPPQFLVRRIAEEILTEEMTEEYGAQEAREKAKYMISQHV